MIFDENHFGGTTDKSEEILASDTSTITVKIYLTATYNGSLKKWKIPPECQIFWDIEDEQFCKYYNINGLIQKHGNTVTSVIKEMNTKKLTMSNAIKNIMDEYEKYPDQQTG